MSTEPNPSDINDEIEFHLREVADALVNAGWTMEAARLEAERRYGDRRRHAARMQDARRRRVSRPFGEGRWLTSCLEELRYAIRGLIRAPGYTVTAVLTLALVTGANLTMFGIADGLIYRPLKYLRDPSTVHRVYWQWQDRGKVTTSASTQFTRFLDLQRDTTSFSEVAVFAERSVAVGDGAAAQQRKVAAVSATYFGLFDAQPARGRFFTAAEDVVPRGADVAVLGYRFWQSHFGGRDVLGQVLRIGDIRATIVGIAPERFDGVNDGAPPAAFVPVTTYAASTGTDDSKTYFTAYKWGWVHLLVRRTPGVTLNAATEDATRVFNSTWPRYMADNQSIPAAATANPRVILSAVRTGGGPTSGREARTSVWLLAVAFVVLLIGCANVANLSLTRALGRRREVSLKRALGVTSARLVLASVAEAAVLSVAAGWTALAVTQVMRRALEPVLRSLQIADVPVFSDARMLVAAATLAALTSGLTGLIPSLLVRRGDLSNALRGGARGGVSDGIRLRAGLLAFQAMLSVVLLVGAGLFVRSLVAVNVSSLGYDPSRVVLLNRVIPPGGFDATAQRTLRHTLLEAAGTHPNVESAAWMSSAPFVSTSWTDLFVPGVDDANVMGPFTFQATTPDYFRTMGTTILRGRALTADDHAGGPEVAVVSESMARMLWPGREAIGECLRMRLVDSPCRRVVGIAEDIVQRTLEDGPRLHYYVPIDQYPRTYGNGLIVKLRDAAAVQAEETRAALQRVLPAGSYLVAQDLASVVVAQQSSWRMGAAILAGFALLALVVAGVGLYGAVGYDIAQRRHEWAVRVALGADRASIVSMVVGRALRVVIAGVIPGLLIAAAFGQWVRPLLFRTSGFDPITYVLAAAMMIGVAAVAGSLPALRASSTDPNDALRSE